MSRWRRYRPCISSPTLGTYSTMLYVCLPAHRTPQMRWMEKFPFPFLPLAWLGLVCLALGWSTACNPSNETPPARARMTQSTICHTA